MTILRDNWRAGVALAGGALVLLSGCGGSADSTSSVRPQQGNRSDHAASAEHPAAVAAHNRSSKGQGQASTQPHERPHQKSDQGAGRQPAATPSQKSRSNQTAETLAEIKELVGNSGGSKEHTASTPKQIRKLLKELSDPSNGQTSDGHKAGESGTQSGVEEILETLGSG